MNIKDIYVDKDFSEIPYGRYDEDGPDNGQRFREDILLNAIQDYDIVQIHLDGAMGYGSSFLDEAFGGLYRTDGIDKQVIQEKLKIITKLKFLEDNIWQYIKEAKKE